MYAYKLYEFTDRDLSPQSLSSIVL